MVKKTIWAIPCWFFFHGIAEKISKSFYEKEYNEVYNLIVLICKNLPCPYCRNHATRYFSNKTSKDVNTKKKLKMFLFKFHNDVNKRIGHHVFDEDILKKFEVIDIAKAYIFFNQNFYGAYIVNHDFNGWIRNMVQERVKEYLRDNWGNMFRQDDCNEF